VREVVPARLGDPVLEGGDPERLGRGAVARAGAVDGARPRMRASSVEETVIAAVPTKPATSPLPMLLATCSAVRVALMR
jgi:hypothetical protein